MSWLKICDSFTEHAKVVLLSDAALAFWLRCACWLQRQENQYLNGMVPRSLVHVAGQTTRSKALKLAGELVAANAAGTKVHGLWEPVDGGWRFHDWNDYQLEPAASQEKLSREEAARLAGRASAEARRAKNGTAQPFRTPPERPPNEAETFDEGSTKRRSTTKARTSPERLEPPDPDPQPEDPQAAEAILKTDRLRSPERGSSESIRMSSERAAAARPTSLEQALQYPPNVRAELIEREPHLASWLEPHRWPELTAFADAAHDVMGLELPSLGTYERDAGVRALVALFATFTPRQLAKAIAAIPGDPWFKSKRGLSQFSPEVVRRLLDSRPSEGRAKRQPDYEGQRSFRASDVEVTTA